MELIIRAPFYDPSGYSYLARKLAIALVKLGVSVHIQHIENANVKCPLTEEEAEILKYCEQTPMLTRAPLLNICVGHSFLLDINRITLGLTMLESDGIINQWVNKCNFMDVTLVPSTFNAKSFANSGVHPDKLRVFPLGVDTAIFKPEAEPSDKYIRDLYIPPNATEDTFIFMSNFEWIGRKNPEMLLRAYCESFTKDDDVILLLKVYQGEGAFDATGKNIKSKISKFLEEFGDNHPKIILCPGLLTEAEMGALYRQVSCYVTPTSGEGWCLPITEAMATRLPVIATGWSAYLDFLNNDNGYLVDVEELIPVPKFNMPSDPLYADTKWAQPSIESLKQKMRYVYENREEASIKAMRGYANVTSQYTWEHAAVRLKHIIRGTSHLIEPPKRTAIKVNEKLKVGIVVPSLEFEVCGIKEYALDLQKGIGDKAEVILASRYGKPEESPLQDCHVLNYQFEYSLYEKYMLERELSIIRGKPVSITQHSIAFNNWNSNSILKRYSDMLIVHNADMRDYLSNRWTPSYVVMIPHGCETNYVPFEEVRQPDKTINIGFFGMTQPHKGILELILSTQYLKDTRNYDVNLTLYASVNQMSEMSVNYANRLDYMLKNKYFDYITWHKEYAEKKDVIEDLHNCDVIVLPYHAIMNQFGVSGAVRVAMGALKPVITTNINFLSDVTDICFSIPEEFVDFPEILASNIEYVYANPDVGIKVQESIRDYITKNSWESVGSQHVNAWNKLIENVSGRK